MGLVASRIKGLTKSALLVLTVLALFLLSTSKVLAHSGRTDSSGGHNCYVGSCAGTYHYHNGEGGGSSNYLSEAAQARVAGAEYARGDNRAAIESSASVEGKSQGHNDGMAGTSTSLTDNDSIEHCSREINFTNAVSTTYREAYQTVYARTCISIYNDTYRDAYQTANLSAKKIFEQNQEKKIAATLEQKEAEDAENRDEFLLMSGAFGSLAAGSIIWSKYRKLSKK